jgi:ATP-dependent RNA helicase DeaD
MSTFSDFSLKPELIEALDHMGITQPTPIQAIAIPLLCERPCDVIALAQTGTGKTAAFGLPLLQHLDLEGKKPKGLILSPTRELCLQITKELSSYGSRLKGVSVLAVYGGSSMEHQIRTLKSGVQVVAATPGRLLDLANRGLLDLSEIETLILDEADEMLNMGFKEDLDAILNHTPKDKHTWLFSATLPPEVKRIAETYMTAPVQLAVEGAQKGLRTIDHLVYLMHAKDRYAALKRIADVNPDIYGIVFCRTRQDTKEIAEKLIQDGYNADALHGDLSQAQREQVMHRFRIRNIQMLVATDVAARGLDVNDLTHVIHYHLPDDIEVFTHRSGRTARAGKRGTSVVLAHLREKTRLKLIEKKLNIQFHLKDVPNGEEICKVQLLHLIERLKNVVINETEIAPFLSSAYETLEELSREELIQKVVSMEFNRFLEYYKDAPDLNVTDKKAARPRSNQFVTLFVRQGKRDGLTPSILLSYLNEVMHPKKIDVGAIEIQRSFCFFGVERDFVEELVQRARGTMLLGRRAVVDIAEKEPLPAKKALPPFKKRPMVGKRPKKKEFHKN